MRCGMAEDLHEFQMSPAINRAKESHVDHQFLQAIKPYVQVSTLVLAALLVFQAFGIDVDKKVQQWLSRVRAPRTMREKKA
jgi:hypothetical protein